VVEPVFYEATPPKAGTDCPAAHPEELTPELIAAISAAINTTFNKQVVIKKVHFVDTSADDAWSRIARTKIHESHNIHMGY
jgi:hypothetical protein